MAAVTNNPRTKMPVSHNIPYKIVCWNSRGLSAAVPYLRELISIYDIICLSEHWLHDNRLTFFEEISKDVDFFARAGGASGAESYGSRRGQGGVCIMWSKSLKGITPMINIKHDRFCGVRLQNLNGAVFNLFSVYLPARGNADDFSTCLDELGAAIEGTDLGSLNIVCGDMNADPGYLGGPRAYRAPTDRGIILHNFVARYDLLLSNLTNTAKGPVDTHFGLTGQSCIDFIAIPTALSSNLMECYVLMDDSLNTSDHNPVVALMDLGSLPRTCSVFEPPKRIKWNRITPEDMNLLYTTPVNRECEILLRVTNTMPVSPECIDHILSELIGILSRNAANLPHTKFSKRVKPFWPPELSELKRLKVAAFKDWCNAGRPRDNDNVLWARNKACKKSFLKRLRQLSKAYDDERILEAVRTSEFDKDVFWRILRKARQGPKVKVPSVKDEQGNVKHDLKDILEVWR